MDVDALVRLIQSNPKSYRLQGEKRLTLCSELPDFAHRLEAITTVLDTLTPQGKP